MNPRGLVERHLQVLLATCGDLWRRPLGSALTLLGIGVALSVPLLLHVLVANLQAVFADWPDTPRLTLYLADGVSREDARRFADEVAAAKGVADVRLVDRDDALETLRDNGELAAVIDQLASNPLPHVVEVFGDPALDRAGVGALGERLGAAPPVESVQYDLEWLERARAASGLLERVVYVFWGLLLAGVALAIGNSVRMALVTARAEIEIIALVGGSPAFIRRPYLYLGALLGGLGAGVALVASWALFAYLAAPLARFLASYLGEVSIRFATPGISFAVLGVCAAAGWLAALVTVNRFLRDLAPA